MASSGSIPTKEPIFSATPPLETLRVLHSVACQGDVFHVEDPFLISIATVSRADFCADAVRDVFVQLPSQGKAARRVPKASQISELRRTAKWHDPPGEVREEDDLLTGQELRLFQSAAARVNFLAMDRPDPLYSVKVLMRKTASPRTQDLSALKRSPQLEESRSRVVRL